MLPENPHDRVALRFDASLLEIAAQIAGVPAGRSLPSASDGGLAPPAPPAAAAAGGFAPSSAGTGAALSGSAAAGAAGAGAAAGSSESASVQQDSGGLQGAAPWQAALLRELRLTGDGARPELLLGGKMARAPSFDAESRWGDGIISHQVALGASDGV